MSWSEYESAALALSSAKSEWLLQPSHRSRLSLLIIRLERRIDRLLGLDL
jgi:hypothetical protein